MKTYLTVIIPVYNEKDSIEAFHKKISDVMIKSGIDYDLLYVNDGSTDGSREALDGLNTNVIHLDGNLGYGAAIKIGIKNSKSEIIGIIDCDGTYDPNYIPQLLKHMKQMDMVIGQRPREKGLRLLGKGFLTAIASYAVSYKIPDLNSGLRLFRRDMAMHLLPLLPNGFSLTSTITLGALYVPYRIRYFPIEYAQRTGHSKIKPFKAFSGFFMLIVRTIVLFNPLRFFIPSSAFFAGIGLVFLARDVMAGNIAQTSLLFLVNAFILLAIGLLAEAVRSRV